MNFLKKDKISLAEVEQVAALAKLSLSKTQLKKYQKELSEILSYVDLVSQAPEPEEKESIIKDNILRPDIIEPYSDFSVSAMAKKIYGLKKTDNS